MELFDGLSPVETYIADKASALFHPVGGSIELTPLCNMNCRMCYIHQTREEMEKQGRMLTADEWIRIAEEMKDAGVLFLLLTGGEPLVYPEFEKLYCALTDMGFVITINTNGTLLNGRFLDLFTERPCRRLNITLYGKDDNTYADLCNYPGGFTRLMNNIQILKERDIPIRFNCSVTPSNVGQLKEIYEIAEQFDVSVESTCHMMPPGRKGCADLSGFTRLTPEEAGKARVKSFLLRNRTIEPKIAAQNNLNRLLNPEEYIGAGLTCRAGRSGFWVTWRGELMPCGMFHSPSISLKEHNFTDAWDYLVKETCKLRRCKDCDQCDLRPICTTCAAACLTETGSIGGKPEYLCKMTKTFYEELKKIAE